MAQPMMVIDVGSYATSAALVVGDRATLLREPRTNADCWPGVHPSQTGADAHVNILAAIRTRAQLPATDGATPVPVPRTDRLTMVISAGAPAADRQRLLGAGEAAGYADVELIDDTHAAVLDAQVTAGLPEHCLALVCNLGQTWTAALVQVEGDRVATIGWDSCAGGRDLDALLLADFRQHAQEPFESWLAAGGEVAARAQRQAGELVRELKHRLADADAVAGQLDPATPPYHLTRGRVERLMEPGLRWVVAACRSLLARAAAGVSDGLTGQGSVPPGTTISSVAAVVVVGGDARLPGVDWILTDGLGRPLVRPEQPGLALVRGAARWAGTMVRRRIVAEHSRWRVEPLAWSVPGGRARLVRWAVAPGEGYRRGAVLAQVRTADERVFDLTAPDDGMLLATAARVGELVGPTLTAEIRRPASLHAGDLPDKRQMLSTTGEWLLTPDRELLVDCAASARQVRLWSIPDGVLVGEFEPDLGGAQHRGRVFVNPGGRLSLVAWNPSGAFSVFDVRSGRRTASFRDSNAPLHVMVNENQWRLTAAAEDGGSAGRYRRQVATVWDLGTGQRLEKFTDHVAEQLNGYRDRSVVDSFGEQAVSPDGRLRAVPVSNGQGATGRGATGQGATGRGVTGVALREVGTGQEVFRAEHPPSPRVRVAFSASGSLLLANWEAGQHSQVDVWEL